MSLQAGGRSPHSERGVQTFASGSAVECGWNTTRRTANLLPGAFLMPLQLIEPRDKYMMPRHTITHEAVLGHLESVLKAFAAKQEYSKFYVGITGDLENRF